MGIINYIINLIMPYRSKRELPKGVRDNLSLDAQEIYQDTYNSAEEFYSKKSKRKNPNESKEEVASKVAWSAVKSKYKKVDDRWKRIRI